MSLSFTYQREDHADPAFNFGINFIKKFETLKTRLKQSIRLDYTFTRVTIRVAKRYVEKMRINGVKPLSIIKFGGSGALEKGSFREREHGWLKTS